MATHGHKHCHRRDEKDKWPKVISSYAIGNPEAMMVLLEKAEVAVLAVRSSFRLKQPAGHAHVEPVHRWLLVLIYYNIFVPVSCTCVNRGAIRQSKTAFAVIAMAHVIMA